MIFRVKTLALLGIWGMLMGPHLPLISQQETPLNFLFIAVDDLKPNLGCYGDTLSITPRIDELASRGTVFLSNYCQQALCSPSRASLLTGRYPDQTRVWDLTTRMREMDPEIVTLPQYLRQQGYATAATGKIFDSRSVDAGRDAPSWSIPWLPHWDERFYDRAEGRPSYFYASQHARDTIALLEAEAIVAGEDKQEYVKARYFPAFEAAQVSPDAYADGAIANAGMELMDQLAASDDPFFLAIGFHRPHLPFNAPVQFWDLYDPGEFQPAAFRQKAAGSPDLAYHNSGELRAYTGIPGSGELPEDLQRTLIHGYYAATSYIDYLVGRVLDHLDSLGLAENTAVILWGDHGWHLGDHQLWCKHTNFEQATRAPLMISYPGQLRPGTHCSAPTEFTDIAPTLCELAGLELPGYFEGLSMVPLMEDSTAVLREGSLSQYPRGDRMGYSLRTGRFRYTRWNGADGSVVASELYDYQTDPLETVNLATDSAYSFWVRRLDSLVQIRMETPSTQFRVGFRISGTASGGDTLVIPGARVTFAGETRITDPTGQVWFSHPSAGAVYRVTANGYVPDSGAVEPSGDTTFLLVMQDQTYSTLTPQEAVDKMKRGINMGNTLEPPHENEWNNPPASESYFDAYRDAGFDVVRVPVRWHFHTDTEFPFAVDPVWMDRVEVVVDWGLSRGLFIVINAHHEEWIKEDYANPSQRARFDTIWSQIATRFSDKSHRLLFEIINEPYGLTREENDDLHRRILSIIRRTNPERNVIIQGHNWGGSDELIQMAFPADDHLIGSFHTYDPWPFGLEGTGSFGTPVQIAALDSKFAAVKDWSLATGIPAFLGEFGCNRLADYNSRMKHYRAYVDLSLKYGFTFCAWDDGGNFRILQRSLGIWDEVKDILIHSSPDAPVITGLSITGDTLVSLGWYSGPGGHDSLSVQRKSLSTGFTTIAILDSGTGSYLDAEAVTGAPNYYRIIAHYPEGEVKYSHPLRIHVPSFNTSTRGYFLGKPHSIPGTIQAEDFDTGGEGVAYHDLDASNLTGDYRPDEAVDILNLAFEGHHIVNALPGEWYEYSVEVAEERDYLAELFYSSPYSGGSCLVRVGDAQSDTLVLPGTGGWTEAGTLAFGISLKAGAQVLRLSITSLPTFYIDRMEFSAPGYTPAGEIPGIGIRINQETGGDLVIHVSGPSSIEGVQLFTLTGSLVRVHRDGGQEVRLSTAAIQPGLYLVRVMTPKGSRVIRTEIH